MTSVVVDSGGSLLEFSSNGVQQAEQEEVHVAEFPAVIVEPVPSARLEQGYAAQVLVYDDETYMMQDVAEEQEIETEIVETEQKCIIGDIPHTPPLYFFCCNDDRLLWYKLKGTLQPMEKEIELKNVNFILLQHNPRFGGY